MSCRATFGTMILGAATMFGAVACNRAPRDKAPELQTKTPEQAVNQPISVSGCLRAGVATETFVLNSGKAEGGFETATYIIDGKVQNIHLPKRTIVGTWKSQKESGAFNIERQ